MAEERLVLGIESTAHTLGFGIASTSGKILANVNYVYRPREGGIHPREAAQHHSLHTARGVIEVFRRAGIDPKRIDGVAFSAGPGMGPCLRVGATLARALALKLGKPLLAVNHGVAHIEIGRLVTGAEDPVVLYIAGGNTLITAYLDGRYRIFGETLDIAAGNCLDAFGIEAGISTTSLRPIAFSRVIRFLGFLAMIKSSPYCSKILPSWDARVIPICL